ncbi:Jerky protein homolog-like [Plakobranchus ocellatus]|uniref:Jerky protein homolog-like n=1 Tax=Plakobranchus ocellatus TaxID=259542 RepID=A0AAV4BFA3_9GAST|nr:Jerky protein homolog-like [Plakobranchus ocellatus]
MANQDSSTGAGSRKGILSWVSRAQRECKQQGSVLSTGRVSLTTLKELGYLLRANGLQHRPHLIWNCDETNLQFSHKPAKVVARKGQSVLARTSNSKQSHTVLACVNAAGVVMPPFCVVRGKTEAAVSSYSVADAPDGTYWSWQEKAWMTELLGDEWFGNVFLKNCGPERPQILILDSHNSHECVNLLTELVRKT